MLIDLLIQVLMSTSDNQKINPDLSKQVDVTIKRINSKDWGPDFKHVPMVANGN